MRDTKTLLLTLLSAGLVATWVYHIYDKASYSGTKSAKEQGDVDTSAILERVRDSFQNRYTGVINQLNLKLDSSETAVDSLRESREQMLAEINRLKAEIRRILTDPQSTRAELAEARKKMTEMQRRIDELRNENTSLEAERSAMIAKLDKMSGEVAGLTKNMARLDKENTELKDKVSGTAVFMVSALHFTAVDLRNNKEEETAQSKRADRLIASFILQNQANEIMNAEVFVVITEPNGHVLQNSVWDSGTFETMAGTRKNYTRRARFDYEKGEQKQLIFSLDGIEFQKGKYILQVWHKGVLVGETYKVMH